MRDSRGFTLLELVLAITIVGTIALIALGALRIGQRSWEKGDAVVEENQRLRVATERIRQQVAAAAIYISPGENDTVIGFEGDGRDIRFVSRISLVPNREQGLVYVHYRVVETADHGRVLEFYERPVVMLSPSLYGESDPADYHRLIEGMADMNWAYRGGGETMVVPWQAGWDAGESLTLPAAVRLSLRSDDDPPLTVVIRVANPMGE